MGLADSDHRLRIEVVFCPAPGQVDRTELRMVDGATVADALRASGVLERQGLSLEPAPEVGIWCRTAELDATLRDRDRVELYRPLTVDPKEARRLRYRKRGR
jgi:putative ubiquitin-RnfH superfamily antitoxin RatB of RatAB toxin-antitoxin module